MRARKFFPAVLLFALTVTACVGVLLSTLVAQSGQQESKKKIKVGIVGDLSDSMLELGLFAVQNFDSSKGYLEFLTLEEADALRYLEQGEITGYLLVPEGFVPPCVEEEEPAGWLGFALPVVFSSAPPQAARVRHKTAASRRAIIF